MSRLQIEVTGGTGVVGVPPVSYLTLNSTVHVHIDGNSIPAPWGVYPVGPGIEQLNPMTTLIAAKGITVTNSAIAGQSWADMTATPSDVDGAYVVGKTNVLVVWETTNSVFNEGKTAAQTISDFQTYLAGRVAAHPWQYVVMFGTIPRGGRSTDATNNARLVSVDDTIRASPTTYGLDSFIYARDLSPFFQDGNSQQGFMLSTSTCLETTAPYIHPLGSARDLLATRLSQGLQVIPV